MTARQRELKLRRLDAMSVRTLRGEAAQLSGGKPGRLVLRLSASSL